ncbi:hypothetical protein BDV93DRAFT_558430 [Ceratobasidium sp. AG-I]|nr:hypothetical protein BDV93DRAFT_558430 [Ceratobasidium sp. AG-I]
MPPKKKLDMKAFQAQLAAFGMEIRETETGFAPVPIAQGQPAPATKPAKLQRMPAPAPSLNNNNPPATFKPRFKVQKVDKPLGSPGRGKTGYNLEHYLGMDKEAYKLVHHGMKTIMMRTKSIDMTKSITKQPAGAVYSVLQKGVIVYPEFEMYRDAGQWALKGFVHMILRVASGLYRDRINALARKALALKQEAPDIEQPSVADQSFDFDPPYDAQELDIDQSFEATEVPFDAEIPAKAAGNVDASMVIEDDAIEAVAKELSTMSLDINASTYPTHDDEDSGDFEMALTGSASLAHPLAQASLDAPAPPPAQFVPVPTQTSARASTAPVPPTFASALAQTRMSAPRIPPPARSNTQAPDSVSARASAPKPASVPALDSISASARAPAPPSSLDPLAHATPLPPVATPAQVVAPSSTSAFAQFFADAGIINMLTPELDAQLQRFAASSESVRSRLPLMFQAAISSTPLASSATRVVPSVPNPSSTTLLATTTKPQPKTKAAPALEHEFFDPGDLSDAPSASASNLPMSSDHEGDADGTSVPATKVSKSDKPKEKTKPVKGARKAAAGGADGEADGGAGSGTTKRAAKGNPKAVAKAGAKASESASAKVGVKVATKPGGGQTKKPGKAKEALVDEAPKFTPDPGSSSAPRRSTRKPLS